ncbi:hypothetical protein PPMP20_18865 [Paraburkholderia phymatum]|nr:hypothetical protein [Paraburkholderia phymatum]
MRNLLSHRPYLRCLNAKQRRAWFEQHKRLKPKVPIGTAVIPARVRRSYAYVRLT